MNDDDLDELEKPSFIVDEFEDKDNKEYYSFFVNNLMHILSKREAQMLKSFYGIDSDQKRKTLQEIGYDWGLSSERVRQIIVSSIKKLRNNIRIKKEEAKIGDVVRLIISEEIGRVISKKKAADGSTILVLKMNSGETEEVLANGLSYDIIYHSIFEKPSKKTRKTPITVAIDKNTPIFKYGKYTIKNHYNNCWIYDDSDAIVYYSKGNIKQIDDIIYRVYYGFSSFAVYLIEKTNYSKSFVLGNRIINARSFTPLFQVLREATYMDQIEALKFNVKIKKYRIKVSGRWYNDYGQYVSSGNNKATTFKEKPFPKPKKSNNIGDVSKKISLYKKREADIGDIIMYDSKVCTVIDIRKSVLSERLIVEYENGTQDNVKNDISRYIIHNNIEED